MEKKYSTYSDDQLIELFYQRKHESLAFGIIYERYKAIVMSYSKAILSDSERVDDIFQDTFVRFYNALKRDKNVPNIAGLLITTCRNLCYNEKRNKKNNVQVEENHLFEKDYLSFEDKELMELISMSVEFLKEKYRRAFMLREYDGLPYKEIAELEQITIANAKLRVIRAKKQLIEILQPYIKDVQDS